MYKFSDIEKVVLTSGFKPRNVTGSHNNYVDEKTGITVTIPKHTKGVSIGVGQSVLKYCVLIARMNKVNIGSHKYKFDEKIHNFILEHHSKSKENPLFLIPEEIRLIRNITTTEEVFEYLDGYKEQYTKYKFMQKKYKNTDMAMT